MKKIFKIKSNHFYYEIDNALRNKCRVYDDLYTHYECTRGII